MSTIENRVIVLEETATIRKLLYRMCRFADRVDMTHAAEDVQLYADTCMTDDVCFDPSGLSPTLCGKAAVVNGLVAGVGQFQWAVHQVDNVQVDIDIANGTAKLTCLEAIPLKMGKRAKWLLVEPSIDLVKLAGEWRARRIALANMTQLDNAADVWQRR